MDALNESELKLFVDSVRRYFQVIAKQEPQITSAYLATGDLDAHEFNGIVAFSGTYNGHVMVSMPSQLLKELLLLQGETDVSEGNLLDAVGEIANTLGGNARKTLGAGLQISVPVKLRGVSGITARVRKHPYVITMRWNHQPALVCVDMSKR
ncbi:chemotaxis protein CheX [Ramlibacter sp.]|uniref:chemotaxis protein CheX n=1 Tax=Ramlibacter sp. TaxID=1917967 RepID=UPI003D0AFC38